jgi:hypothetical protein
MQIAKYASRSWPHLELKIEVYLHHGSLRIATKKQLRLDFAKNKIVMGRLPDDVTARPLILFFTVHAAAA